MNSLLETSLLLEFDFLLQHWHLLKSVLDSTSKSRHILLLPSCWLCTKKLFELRSNPKHKQAWLLPVTVADILEISALPTTKSSPKTNFPIPYGAKSCSLKLCLRSRIITSGTLCRGFIEFIMYRWYEQLEILNGNDGDGRIRVIMVKLPCFQNARTTHIWKLLENEKSPWQVLPKSTSLCCLFLNCWLSHSVPCP